MTVEGSCLRASGHSRIRRARVEVLVRTGHERQPERAKKLRECAETEQTCGLSAKPAVLGGQKAAKFRLPPSLLR